MKMTRRPLDTRYKSRYLSIGLSICALIIWLAVVMTISEASVEIKSSKKEDLILSEVKFDVKPPDLSLDYPDPFYPEVKKAKQKNRSIAKKRKRDQPIASKYLPVLWPKIEFRGMVKNATKNTVMAVVRQDKVDRLCRIGDAFGEFVISGISSDSLIVSNKTMSKAYYKNS